MDSVSEEGRRKRFYFRARADAQRFVSQRREDQRLLGEAWVEAGAQVRADIQGVWREVTARGLTLREVWEDYNRQKGSQSEGGGRVGKSKGFS